MIIKEERINTGRQKEFDIVKALAIIFMITIHVYEELSVVDSSVICSKPFDVILQFLGGPFAAPVFMFSLGLGLAYSSHRSPNEIMLRGLKLFIFSYIFNFIRFGIPMLLSTGFKNIDVDYLCYMLFHVDILTFAGLTFILTGFLKRIGVRVLGTFIIALILQGLGPILTYFINLNSKLLMYLTIPFIKVSDLSYFPLFQWYIYPALGLLFAKYLKHVENRDKFYLYLLGVSASILFVFCSTLSFIKYDIRKLFTLAEESYYYQTIIHTFFTLFCIIFELSIVHFFVKFIHLPKLFKVVSFMSSKLNNIYIAQWVIIGWTEFLIIDEGISVALIVPVGILITVISCLIVYFYLKFKNRKKKTKDILQNESLEVK